tara:strand:+ start:11842 stop:12801 length:960 start_codon:yes stop_codon:yes gene_type:complete
MQIRFIVGWIMISLTASTALISGQSVHGTDPWVDATHDITGGSAHLISMTFDGPGMVYAEVQEAPILIEVYTATWCETCIPAEEALNSSIWSLDTYVVKYHRHLFETEDPFGNNNTEGRWLSRYGPASIEANFSSRTPPTVVFGGERMHVGSYPNEGMTLEQEYLQSLEAHVRPPILEGSNISVSLENNFLNWSWKWVQDKSICRSICGEIQTNLYLLTVEKKAYFPEGSNGQSMYYDILRDITPLDPSGSIEYIPPAAWDEQDLELVIIFDWNEIPEEKSSMGILPFSGPLTSIIILASTSIILRYFGKNNLGFNNLR